jgi:hypothetical protein
MVTNTDRHGSPRSKLPKDASCDSEGGWLLSRAASPSACCTCENGDTDASKCPRVLDGPPLAMLNTLTVMLPLSGVSTDPAPLDASPVAGCRRAAIVARLLSPTDGTPTTACCAELKPAVALAHTLLPELQLRRRPPAELLRAHREHQQTRTHTRTDTHRHAQTRTDTHRHAQTRTDTHRHARTHTHARTRTPHTHDTCARHIRTQTDR